MANSEHIEVLKTGVPAWNAWRNSGRNYFPVDLSNADLRRLKLADVDFYWSDLRNTDLREATLTGANLHRARLDRANLERADFRDARLAEAKFTGANLTYARLTRADLTYADFSNATLKDASLEHADINHATFCNANLFRADLNYARVHESDFSGCNFQGAHLSWAHFFNVDLSGADFTHAALQVTIFTQTDLSGAVGLDACDFRYPSVIDHSSLAKSGELPIEFLNGCGLPEAIIQAIPMLRGMRIQFNSCFISYSSRDQEFAERLYSDLQAKGVRCWFAPHDLKIGAKTREAIHDAILIYDKLLLILSRHSVASDWVEDEVERALEKERKQRRTVLFPVRLDKKIMNVADGWPVTVLNSRNIGDFEGWHDEDEYARSLQRLLRDLKREEYPVT